MESTQNKTCSISINNGYKTISVKPGGSLLVALSRNAIFVPSACGGNARCGYCKVKVTQGNTGVTLPEEPLISEQEKSDGFRLSCQLTVQSDLSIEIPQHLFNVKRFSGKVIEKSLLTYDILYLKISLSTPMNFRAGQYVQLKSIAYDDKPAVLRDFSIASSPSDPSNITLMIRKIPNGIFTPWAFDHVTIGDSISLTGPYGDFCATNTQAPMLMIAGGSGMAPLWSLLSDLREKKSNRSITYFFGALTQRDLFMVNELNALKSHFSDFKFIPALSNEPDGSDWQGERGLITDVVARHIPDCSGYESYLCGSPGMIKACIGVLKRCGIPDNKIFFDKFA